MGIRIKVKQSSRCKECKDIGYYSVSEDTRYQDKPVEYVCNNCDGSGEIWKDKNMPLSSLRDLLQ